MRDTAALCLIFAGSIISIAAGLLPLFFKYRVVVGGTVCAARVKRCERFSSYKGVKTYKYIMGFTYNGKYLVKPSLNSTIRPNKSIGKTFAIYYNDKHSKYVVNKSINIEMISAFCILICLAVFRRAKNNRVQGIEPAFHFVDDPK